MPSHMRDPNAPKPDKPTQPTAPQPTQQAPGSTGPTQQVPGAGATQQAPGSTGPTQQVPGVPTIPTGTAAPGATQQAPRPAGSRFATNDQPSPYASEPQQVELPERSGPRLWWAWVILAAIVVVGVIWIWFFVIPHPEGSYEDVQGVEQGEVVEEGTAPEGENAENPDAGVDVPEGESAAIGSQGPLTMANPNGSIWNAEVSSDLPVPMELHGVADNGVTLAFFPDETGQQIVCHITSVQVDGQTYEAGAPDSPLHIQITAGGQGARDITGDPTFDVGSIDGGDPYGQRILVSVDGLTEAQYNGMVVNLEETPAGGAPVTGTVTLSSQQAA